MEFKEYIAPLRKWWWLILLTMIVAAISSYLATKQQLPTYQARAILLTGSTIDEINPLNNEFTLGQQLARTYADLAQFDQVRQATKEALGINGLPQYTVNQIPNTQFIEIVVTDTSPERAMVVANELANQLVLRSPANDQYDEERQIFLDQQLDDLEAQINETREKIEAKQSELAQAFTARQISDAQGQLSALETKLNTLQTNYTSLLEVTNQGATNTIRVIQQATIPTVPVGPNQLLTIVITVVVGMLLSGGAAYLLDYLDDTVKSVEDIQAAHQLATLAGIASMKAGEDHRLITSEHPRSPISEAYRMLRTGIRFSMVDKRNHVLLVISSNPREGKSTTASNLAVVMAQSGLRVVLIDADLRRPSQHKIFKMKATEGLTTLLLDWDSESQPETNQDLLESVIQHSQQSEKLHVLPCGPIPPNPSEILSSGKMKALLGELTKRYDICVIDSPPVLAVTDGVILSTLADSVLLVVHSGRTRREHLKRAVSKLKEANANLIGVVLNQLSTRHDEYYYYQHNYYTAADEAPTTTPAGGRGSKLFGRLRWRNKTV